MDLKANPEEMESKVEHQEVPKEEAVVKSSGAQKKRHRGWNLAAGCHGKSKELTRRDCGSRRKLAAACRKGSCRTRVTWCNGYLIKKNQTRKNIARGAPRGQTFGKRHWVDPEGSTGVRDPGTRQQLHHKIKRTADGRIFGKTCRLEIAKSIAGSFVGLQKIRDWTLWGVGLLQNGRKTCYQC
jgi:hypothetical protein